MKQKLSKDQISQEVFDLFDKYVHNKLERREFVEQLSKYAIGGLTVTAMLDFLLPRYTEAKQVDSGDPRIKSKYVKYKSPKGAGKMRGLLVRPRAAKGRLPGIVVVHENRGLNPHIEDVARRAALEGFVAFAPDALYPLGGYPGNDDDGRKMQRERDRNEMLEDFIAAFHHLKDYKKCTGRVGVVGFCFGGWISNMMAVNLPDLGASVPFYGGQPASEDVHKIKAPLMLQFAGLDKRVNAGWPAYEEALKKEGKTYAAHMYPDVNHGFHNDTTPRFDKPAAELAWQRTIDFFKENLK